MLIGASTPFERVWGPLSARAEAIQEFEQVVLDPRGASVSRDYAGRWNCTEWQHADLNYAEELARGHRRRSGPLHGYGSRSVSFRREGTSPVERWSGHVPARSVIGLAHPSARPG